jgi:hypothetical protein
MGPHAIAWHSACLQTLTNAFYHSLRTQHAKKSITQARSQKSVESHDHDHAIAFGPCGGSCLYWYYDGEWFEQNSCNSNCECISPDAEPFEGIIVVTRCAPSVNATAARAKGKPEWKGKGVLRKGIPKDSKKWFACALTIEATGGLRWQYYPEGSQGNNNVMANALSQVDSAAGTVLIFETDGDQHVELIGSGRIVPTSNRQSAIAKLK